MQENNLVKYGIYGNGKELLFAFHGYGLDGFQYKILDNLCDNYSIIGFHLPYHQLGPKTHEGWLNELIGFINDYVENHQIQRFSIVGYSIGAKIALYLTQHFKVKLSKLYLFAPYGFESYWGLDFISKGFGNLFFQTVVNTSLPLFIMRMVKKMGFIDQHHFEIVEKEIGTKEQRSNLCNTLNFVGEIEFSRDFLIDLLNNHQIKVVVVYGKQDVLFPYKERNIALLDQLLLKKIIAVDEGHWMMTDKMNRLFSKEMDSL